MSTNERTFDDGAMPDWTGWADECDRIDWQPIDELGGVRQWAPRAVAQDV